MFNAQMSQVSGDNSVFGITISLFFTFFIFFDFESELNLRKWNCPHIVRTFI